MLNKRGQVAETMTWVVATLIIIVLLSISIYAATLLANVKSVSDQGSSFFSLGYSRTQDVVMENSLFFSFQIQDPDKAKILEDLKKMNDREEFPYKNFDSKYTQIKFNLEKYGKR